MQCTITLEFDQSNVKLYVVQLYDVTRSLQPLCTHGYRCSYTLVCISICSSQWFHGTHTTVLLVLDVQPDLQDAKDCCSSHIFYGLFAS